MSSIKDVAKVAGVGKSTVSRVVNDSGYVSPQVKEKIHQAIEQIGYKPNQIARSLKLQRSNTVALFVPTVDHPFFAQMTKWIEDYLYQKKYKLVLVNSQGNQKKETALLGMSKENLVDGVIFITHHVYKAVDETIPMVTIDRHLGMSVPCITTDNFDATFRAIHFLYQKGCRHIGFICGHPRASSEVEFRLEGYKKACEVLGLDPFYSYEEFEHGEEFEIAAQFLNDHDDMDGILCSGDLLANCMYQSALLKGLSVPQQLKIIAYDGIMDAWIQHPVVTKIKQNIQEMAKVTVETLLQRIHGEPCPKKIVIPTSFIEGETT